MSGKTRKIRTLVVDDEEPARSLILRLLNDYPEFDVVGRAANGIDALRIIKDLSPDLLFLDVQMPRMSGIELLKKIGSDNCPHIVFVTAFDQYAVRAFEFHALDYLLKPFKKSRFATCLEHVRSILKNGRNAQRPQLKSLIQYYSGDSNTVNNETRYLQRIFVKSRTSQITVGVEEIDYLEAANQYTAIVAGKTKYIYSRPLNWFEENLDPARFVRIHRGYMVNIAKVIRFIADGDGQYVLELKCGSKLNVSRRRVARLRQHLAGLN